MKLKSWMVLSAVVLGAFVSSGRAQLLTADTVSGFTGSAGLGSGRSLGNSAALTQTFSSITSIQALTFRFIADESATFSSMTLDTYFSVWSGNKASTQVGAGPGSIALAASGAWTNTGDGYIFYDATMDLSAVATGLNSATTYGLSILGNTNSRDAGIVLSGGSSSYAGGSGYIKSSGVTGFSGLTSSSSSIGNDYVFSAAAIAPIPEASTIAVLFAGVFVSGLVVYRVRQQRLQAVQPAVIG